MLNSWPEKKIERFETLAKAFSDSHHYAVFDADGTLWSNDLSEGLLALLESEGIITDKSISGEMWLIPKPPEESLVSYYLRLCDVDISLGYFWLCQAFAGFTMGELKPWIDKLFKEKTPIRVMINTTDGLKEKEIGRPAVFDWQRDLITFLREKGITVYIVTASQEELVRMVVSDPDYGFNIPSVNVVGMRLALRSADGKRLLTQPEKELDTDYYQSTLTASLAGMTTWYAGKVAAIRSYIEPFEKPALVAGNSESDLEMLQYTDGSPAIRLLVTENAGFLKEQREALCRISLSESTTDVRFANTEGWVFVDPNQFDLAD